MYGIPRWNVEEMCGYHPITTFWEDFSIADRSGLHAVKDTFKRAFGEWKGDYKYLTELVMVLNHKMWQYSESNEKLVELYQDLWEQADAYAEETLKDDELGYYYQTID